MSTHFASHFRSARRLAALCAIALCALSATVAPALAGGADKPAHKAGKTVTFRFYSVTASLVLRHADGTVVENPTGPPVAGDELEIIENAYAGTHAKHSKKVVATSHTVCVFTTAKPEPTCDGQGAVGGNQMLLFRTPSGGDTTVVGGTGRFLGATGTVTSTEVGNTNNSDLVIVVQLSK